MIQIRRGVFETNSSSVHNMTMCSVDVFDKWIEDFNNLTEKDYDDDIEITYFDEYDIKTEKLSEILNITDIKTKEDFLNKIENSTLNDFLYDYEILSTDSYDCKYCQYYETFEQEKDGVVAFGYYGYDS